MLTSHVMVLFALRCHFSTAHIFVFFFSFLLVRSSLKETTKQSRSWTYLWSPHLWPCWSWGGKLQIDEGFLIRQEIGSSSWKQTLLCLHWRRFWECGRIEALEGGAVRVVQRRGNLLLRLPFISLYCWSKVFLRAGTCFFCRSSRI